jgi:hypothetical protein
MPRALKCSFFQIYCPKPCTQFCSDMRATRPVHLIIISDKQYKLWSSAPIRQSPPVSRQFLSTPVALETLQGRHTAIQIRTGAHLGLRLCSVFWDATPCNSVAMYCFEVSQEPASISEVLWNVDQFICILCCEKLILLCLSFCSRLWMVMMMFQSSTLSILHPTHSLNVTGVTMRAV